jgi:hypothetical protein
VRRTTPYRDLDRGADGDDAMRESAPAQTRTEQGDALASNDRRPVTRGRSPLDAVRDPRLDAQRLADDRVHVRRRVLAGVELVAQAREARGVQEQVEERVPDRGADRVCARDDRGCRLEAKRLDVQRGVRALVILVQLRCVRPGFGGRSGRSRRTR